MKATQQLKDEHVGIKLMMEILDRICTKMESGEKINPEHLKKIVEFIRIFADKCHHAKEEDILFPAMENAGIPKQGGPIGVMLMEHDMGRNYVKGMADGLELYEKNPSSYSKFTENARGYVNLLTNHIEKEDNILYAMADARFSEKEQDIMCDEFEKIEVERIGEGRHEQFHNLLKELKSIYL